MRSTSSHAVTSTTEATLPRRMYVSGLDLLILQQCVVRENDGRKLDHQTLEAMRLRAVDAVESGVHPEDVAASLGMGRGTVYGWLAKYREGWPGRVEGAAGAGAATEAVRGADAPALHADHGRGPAAAGVRVRAVDPGYGP